MSYCKQEGKDQIIFITKEDHEKPSEITLPEDDKEPRGLIASDGSINWDCPCLGGMASGPCGVQFREAFSCFHYSETEPKGNDCYNQFATMQECMSNYPGLYPKSNSPDLDLLDEDDLLEEDDAASLEASPHNTVNNPSESATNSASNDSVLNKQS